MTIIFNQIFEKKFAKKKSSPKYAGEKKAAAQISLLADARTCFLRFSLRGDF